MMQDTFTHKGLRLRMVESLKEKGITDEAVLKAMNDVPRHFFLPAGLDVVAYDESPVKIGFEQTISRPSTVAMQSQLLQVKRGMKVLEIGTGSGYQTAVLCRLGARVFTIERQKGLFDHTKPLLQQLGYNARCFLGDGAPTIPEALMAQLKLGGIMVIPVGEVEQEMLRITKNGESEAEWQVEKFGIFNFVPMLEGKEMKK